MRRYLHARSGRFGLRHSLYMLDGAASEARVFVVERDALARCDGFDARSECDAKVAAAAGGVVVDEARHGGLAVAHLCEQLGM